MDNEGARRALLGLIRAEQIIPEVWREKTFVDLKVTSTTKKGDMGEDFLAVILRQCGYNDVVVVKGRRGDYDVRLCSGGKTIDFEVKVATQDTKGKFQFNGIRLDTRYTHLFCIAVLPENIKFLIVPKPWLNNRDDYRMVSMAKGSNAAFKLHRKEAQLKEFNNFEDEVRQILV